MKPTQKKADWKGIRDILMTLFDHLNPPYFCTFQSFV